MQQVELYDNILLKVSRPARYIGEEFNIIKKLWSDDKIKICLCYPDVYEVGMSHLGLKILYHILNKRQDLLCERSFAPWLDMEDMMRKNDIPLFSLENKMPLASFDIIAFSLQYELTYTNLLNMLNLSGIPLKWQMRSKESFPLVIAGGPSAFNPEPLADFMDLFFIGDGEEGIIDIVETYKRFKGRGREKLLEEMAKIEGVYAPSLYSVSYKEYRVERIRPKFPDIPKTIKRRIYKSLKPDDISTSPIVPYISTIHDRIMLEIMRGCAHNCRFCQAKSIYGPVRIRDADEILELADQTYKNTGLDEISLVSLSSSSYPNIDRLIKGLSDKFVDLGVGISLPSLRIEEDLDKLPSLLSAIRKTGLTFAPEAGTEKMLSILNKGIKFNELFEALKAAYKAGWRRIKLYFMIGLPFEKEKDLEAIIELAQEAAMLKKEVSTSPAEVTVNVSSFIPKPHTPFQWMGMADIDRLKEKQRFLLERARGKRYLRLKFHNPATSILEGVFSRGDRRLAEVLLEAWKDGARFDAWNESFKPDIWDDVFRRKDIDKKNYLGEYELEETLPWDHISCGTDKEVLKAEYKAAIEVAS